MEIVRRQGAGGPVPTMKVRATPDREVEQRDRRLGPVLDDAAEQSCLLNLAHPLPPSH